MSEKGLTIKEAAQRWVNEFNAIPYAICEKLLNNDCDELHEITPPSKYDQIYIYGGDYAGEHGEIIRVSEDDDDTYIVQIDGGKEEVEIHQGDFEVDRDGFLPMWGMLWAFGDSIDNWWLEEKGGLQAMADCGFRIYEQEDYGYIFGIDGAGYDFYEQHWIPLYKARGLQWHDKEEKNNVAC